MDANKNQPDLYSGKYAAEWFTKLLEDTLTGTYYPTPSPAAVRGCAEIYVKLLEERVGSIQVLNAPNPVKVSEIFVLAKVVSRKHFLRGASPQILQKEFLDSNSRDFFSAAERQDAVQLANKHQYLVVLGDPGVGKSTFLKRIALEAKKPGAQIFQENDIISQKELTAKLLDPAGVLFPLVTESERDVLKKCRFEPEGEIKQTNDILLNIINRAIELNKPIFTKDQIQENMLRFETRLFLNQSPTDKSDLLRLNRLLLEDVCRGILDSTTAFILENRLVPVFIEMNKYREDIGEEIGEDKSENKKNEDRKSSPRKQVSQSYLKDRIIKFFEEAGFPDSTGTIEILLQKGKVLLLLDGLDEVPDKYFDEAITEINCFVRTYFGNRYIISSRAAFYNQTYFQNFAEVTMAYFDNIQIENFVYNYFSQQKTADNDEKRDDFLKGIFDKANFETLELARTPLLLMFLCMTYDPAITFASSRSMLYDRILQVLIIMWQTGKRLGRASVSALIEPDFELSLLKDVAAKTFETDLIYIPHYELDKHISKYLSEASHGPKGIDTSHLRREIAEKQGLFSERTRIVYTFSHLTLQEYLAACHYVETNDVKRVVTRYFLNSSWREVFLFIMSKTFNQEHFFSMTEALLRFVIRHIGNLSLFRWMANECYRNNNNLENAARRAIGAYITLWIAGRPETERMEQICLDIARLLWPEILDFELIQQFENYDFISKSKSLEAGRPYANDLMKSLQKNRILKDNVITTFRLLVDKEVERRKNPEIVHQQIPELLSRSIGSHGPEYFSNSEQRPNFWKDIQEYLYGTKLLVECCKVAAGSKKETETKIFSKILDIELALSDAETIKD